MFAFHSKYLAPDEEVDKHLDAHRAYLKTLIANNILVCSGPKVPRNGGFILLNALTRTEAEQIMADDPYVIKGIAKYEMIEFDLKSCDEGFRELLK
ncbi:MAG: YciI family protein [Bacteroidetes bacterium]|nr:YciI family protein [Bacteroidota bacterium]